MVWNVLDGSENSDTRCKLGLKRFLKADHELGKLDYTSTDQWVTTEWPQVKVSRDILNSLLIDIAKGEVNVLFDYSWYFPKEN